MEPLVPPSAPVLRLTRPTPSHVATLASVSRDLPLSYEQVGATLGEHPQGYDHDRQGDVVGVGERDYRSLVAAVRGWVMFDLPWVELHDPSAPIETGRVIAFSSHQLGLWVINLCRIVRVVDTTDGDVERFGFAYGTLPGHAVSGEELFLATWDRTTDRVRFSVSKFSRARHPLVRLSGPMGRAIQRRFSRQAIARMARAVKESR